MGTAVLLLAGALCDRPGCVETPDIPDAATNGPSCLVSVVPDMILILCVHQCWVEMWPHESVKQAWADLTQVTELI